MTKFGINFCGSFNRFNTHMKTYVSLPDWLIKFVQRSQDTRTQFADVFDPLFVDLLLHYWPQVAVHRASGMFGGQSAGRIKSGFSLVNTPPVSRSSPAGYTLYSLVETRRTLTADEYLAEVFASVGVPGSIDREIWHQARRNKCWLFREPTDTPTDAIKRTAEGRARTRQTSYGNLFPCIANTVILAICLVGDGEHFFICKTRKLTRLAAAYAYDPGGGAAPSGKAIFSGGR